MLIDIFTVIPCISLYVSEVGKIKNLYRIWRFYSLFKSVYCWWDTYEIKIMYYIINMIFEKD